jgi:hypothetical protein
MTDHYFDEDSLPNYEARCAALTVVLIVSAVFWIVLFPFAVGKFFFFESPSAVAPAPPKQPTEPKPATAKQRRDKHKKINYNIPSKNTEEPPEPPSVPLFVLAVAALGCMASLFYEIMLLSPYNTFVARGVFQAPLLTDEECQYLLNISMRVAERNKEAGLREKELSELSGEPLNKTMKWLLEEPVGWQKLRHQNYPTTDVSWFRTISSSVASVFSYSLCLRKAVIRTPVGHSFSK